MVAAFLIEGRGAHGIARDAAAELVGFTELGAGAGVLVVAGEAVEAESALLARSWGVLRSLCS